MADNRPLIVETGSRGSGASWVIAIVLIVALVLGVIFFSRMSASETAKDNAVTSAANSVGDAAKDVGSAARDAAGNQQ